jgi:hypothetical protein
MKKIIELLKKYKVYILGILLVVFFVRSCGRGVTITKMEKVEKVQIEEIDSLNGVIKIKTQKIDSFPEFLRLEKLNLHMDYDHYISKQDRGEQLMDLHMVVKDNIKDLQK